VVPAWLVALVGLLTGAVLILGYAWWRSAAPPVATAPAPQTIVRETWEIAEPVEPPPPARSVRSLADEAAPPEPPAADTAAASVGPSAVSSPDASAGSPAAPQRSPAPAADEPPALLPSAAELIAEGELPMPEPALELHVFSDEPSRRFVFIDTVKYREGERIANGSSVRSIVAEGVVLETPGGRRYLLPRD
jgi:general secretion pathway protein B